VSGRYEVRRETRLGVQVVGIYWIAEGEPSMLVLVLGEERVPMLRDALSAYLKLLALG
jgi:hypothetical protein